MRNITKLNKNTAAPCKPSFPQEPQQTSQLGREQVLPFQPPKKKRELHKATTFLWICESIRPPFPELLR